MMKWNQKESTRKGLKILIMHKPVKNSPEGWFEILGGNCKKVQIAISL